MSDRSKIPGVTGDRLTPHAQARPSPELLRWEQERELTIEFFRLVNDSDSLPSLIGAAVDFFQQHSQCQAVAVRLRCGNDFPYAHALGFSKEFLVCENHLAARDCFGEIISDNTGAATLECRCGQVITGRFDAAQPFFTAHGSFWTNNADDDRLPACRPPAHRGRCRDEGYQSIALIALKAGKQRIGLLQLNDKLAGRFTQENILFWESLANHLAVALARFLAEETLRKSEQRLMQAVNIGRLGIFEHDHATGLAHSSQTFQSIYGLDNNTPATPNQVLERILHEDREPLVAALYRSLDPAGDGLLQREHRILHPNGIRWLFVRAQTFFEGQDAARHPIRTVGAVIDITARKQTELELSASRQQLRTALDAAQLGIWSRDLATGILTCDALARSIVGVQDDEILTSESMLRYVLPEDRERWVGLRAQLEQSDRSLSSEFRIRTPNGAVRWVSIWGNLVRDASGQPSKLAGVVQDITGRKRAEEQIKQLEEQFRHAQKMEAVGRLAGGIAHDFNNLLMVIRSYTELLEDTLPAKAAARRNTQAILLAAGRAASLTAQMLAFSRKQVLSPVPLNLNDAVEEAANMLQRLIGEDIDLRVKAAASLWTVRADPDQVAQVLMNLSVNSRDAMPMGGILTLETRNVTSSPSLIERHPFIAPGDYVVLSVTDTGIGIPKEVQGRMFEPFFTTKGVGKGTGLGLSSVYGIVKQSGGYLLCESEPGRGASFSVYLPRIHHDLSEAELYEANWLLHGNETILIVEDEEALRESMGQFLTRLGYTVLAAGSGQQAISIANQRKEPIHLMISDVVMPRMSGRELSQTLLSVRPAMKTIFMSGYIDDAIERHGVQMEGVVFLQKPFSLTVLARKLRALLG
jgi:two-component system, cell cycle sensor histidine kinase and response regulator CckA